MGQEINMNKPLFLRAADRERSKRRAQYRYKTKVRLILLDFADYLIYYTRKEVTYELLTHEYNYWR